MKKPKVSKAFFQSFNSYFSRLPSGNRQTIGGQVIHNSNSGFAFVLIIIAVVLIFSIALVSGADKFTLSEEKPPTSSRGGVNPTQPPGNQTQWTITYTITSCENGLAKGTISTTSPANGYVTLERQDPSGNYQIMSSDQAISPTASLGLNLLSTDGYATTPWRLNLFEGGSGGKDNFSGGTVRTTIQGSPTGCS